MSDMEGKVTRVGASERGQRTSFNGAAGMSDIEGEVTRVGASERGQRMSFKWSARAMRSSSLPARGTRSRLQSHYAFSVAAHRLMRTRIRILNNR